MSRLGLCCLILGLLASASLAIPRPIGEVIGCEGITLPESTTGLPQNKRHNTESLAPVADVLTVPSTPLATVLLDTIDLWVIPNEYSVVYCPVVVVESLTVDDGYIRQVVGPLQVNSNILVSSSVLLLQAEVSVANDVSLSQSNLIISNRTSVNGRMTVSEGSTTSVLSKTQVTSFDLHSNSSLELGSANDNRLPDDAIIGINSCNVEMNGDLVVLLSDRQIQLILDALNTTESISVPLIDVKCPTNISVPPKRQKSLEKQAISSQQCCSSFLLPKIMRHHSQPSVACFHWRSTHLSKKDQ